MKNALTILLVSLLVFQASLVLAGDDQKATLSKQLGAKKSTAKFHWYVVVCSSRAEHVDLQAGGNDNDNAVFGTWQQGDGQKRYPLPEGLQARTKVYVQLAIPDGKWQTEACVGHDGYAKKAFRFDSHKENHNVSYDESDSGCACR